MFQGEIIMDDRLLMRKAAKLRAVKVESDIGLISGSIAYLDGLLKEDLSIDDKYQLFFLIVDECFRSGNRNAEEYYLRRQISELPLQPILLTNLAQFLVNDSGKAKEALAFCEEAVRLAINEDRQVRYALTCQVRIALALDDYEVLSSALRGLIADAAPNRVNEDSIYYFDFVDKIDANRIDFALLERYKALESMKLNTWENSR